MDDFEWPTLLGNDLVVDIEDRVRCADELAMPIDVDGEEARELVRYIRQLQRRVRYLEGGDDWDSDE